MRRLVIGAGFALLVGVAATLAGGSASAYDGGTIYCSDFVNTSQPAGSTPEDYVDLTIPVTVVPYDMTEQPAAVRLKFGEVVRVCRPKSKAFGDVRVFSSRAGTTKYESFTNASKDYATIYVSDQGAQAPWNMGKLGGIDYTGDYNKSSGVGTASQAVATLYWHGVRPTLSSKRLAARPPPGWAVQPGGLVQVSVGSDGTVVGVNAADQIWRWNGSMWQALPGGLRQVAVGNANNIWGLNSAGDIWRWAGSGWQNIRGPGGKAFGIAAASDGTVYVVTEPGNLHKWNGSTFTSTGQTSIRWVSAGAAGRVWTIDTNNRVSFLDASTWRPVPGAPALKQVSVGSDGACVGLGLDNEVWRYSTASGWQAVADARLLSVGVGSASNIWGTAETNAVARAPAGFTTPGNDPPKSPSPPSPSPSPPSPPSPGPTQIAFAGTIRQVSYGQGDGTVVFLADPPANEPMPNNFAIYKRDANNGQITKLPGGLRQIAVASANNIWGVNYAQQIFRWKAASSNWELMPGAAVHVCAAFDGTVFAVNAAGELFKFRNDPIWLPWSPPGIKFRQIECGGQQNIWGLTEGGSIYRSTNGGASFAVVDGGLRNISVGVATVMGTNVNSQMFKWTASGWALQPGSFAQVAVVNDKEFFTLNAQGQLWKQ